MPPMPTGASSRAGSQRWMEAAARSLSERHPSSRPGGGQPHDTGTLDLPTGVAPVAGVAKDRTGLVWHTLAGEAALPNVGVAVRGTLDWERRYLLM